MARKLQPVTHRRSPEGPIETTGYQFRCPGCGTKHWVRTLPYLPNEEGGPVWKFNGDEAAPTFAPSVLCDPAWGYKHRCHSFVRDGRIQFLGDCTHELAGKTVPLPDID